jgi:hypothetical protein
VRPVLRRDHVISRVRIVAGDWIGHAPLKRRLMRPATAGNKSRCAARSDGNRHRSPMQAVTMMKIPSANSVVSTMTPMISSPHGNRSRAIATNAYMGVNALLRRTGNHSRQCQVELGPVLIRCCQDSSAKRSRFSHFGHRGATPSRMQSRVRI